MKRILAIALVVCSASAFAQEIGKEIPADQQTNTTPPQDQTPNYDNPYATTPPPPPPPTRKDDAAAADADGVAGPRKGAFGFRASFGGGGIPVITVGSAVLGVGAPTIGLRYFATDALATDIDVGVMTVFANQMSLGFGAGLGINYYLGRKELPVRPFAHGGFGFGRLTSVLGSGDVWAMSFNVGGGGEYWVSDFLSLNVRALLGIPVTITSSSTSVSLATFTPGIGLTIYF